MNFLLYGANGYTGQLIAEAAAGYGLSPILAGRNEAKITDLASRYGFDHKVFDLQSPQQLDEALEGVEVVLHAAGPFIHTARPMIEACLRTKTHYLDITGEIPVFELAHQYDEAARSAGIMIMPGVGFDVVPTDCLALYLKEQLPDADHLKLAFSALGGGVSHGTATTAVEMLGKPGAIREDGKIVEVPIGHKAMWVPFHQKELFCMTIPWGDVSTAYYTTGIPNIETYTGIKPSAYKLMKGQRYLNWLLRQQFVKDLAKKWVEKQPAGPDAEQRAHSQGVVWGEVKNARGEKRQARQVGPEGYTLTIHSSLIITRKVLQGHAPVGFQTPAGAYGAGLVLEIEGVERQDLPVSK